MKIRQVHIQDFRNFSADAKPIPFHDESTGQVRELSVVVGSNGCGKTTILEIIFSYVDFMSTLQNPNFSPSIMSKPRFLVSADIIIDNLEPLKEVNISFSTNNTQITKPAHQIIGITYDNKLNTFRYAHDSVPSVQLSIRNQITANQSAIEGLIYFPHHRWQDFKQRGRVDQPPEGRSWLYRWRPTDEWQGSLSQLWVWQNYLDLEAAREGRLSLTPFVEIIETILGRDQKVFIRKGKVFIRRPHVGDEIEPDALPAGEKQVLVLFGELARWLKPGAVVMIDEVETSLHPSLQRVVLHHLRKLARKYDLQIILTTHSMAIVEAVAPNEVINLDDMVLEERSRRSAS